MKTISLLPLASVLFVLVVAPAMAKPTPTPPPGGSYQRTSVEGCINQNLFDGWWRFKVTSVRMAREPGFPNNPAYGVTMRLSNARERESTPALVGVGQPQLVLQDGTILEQFVESGIAYNREILYLNIPPGGSGQGTFYFRPEGNTAKPVKLLLGINPLNPVYHTPWGYPAKNPSFRVHLDCSK